MVNVVVWFGKWGLRLRRNVLMFVSRGYISEYSEDRGIGCSEICVSYKNLHCVSSELTANLRFLTLSQSRISISFFA